MCTQDWRESVIKRKYSYHVEIGMVDGGGVGGLREEVRGEGRNLIDDPSKLSHLIDNFYFEREN